MRSRLLIAAAGSLAVGLLSSTQSYFWGRLSGHPVAFGRALLLQGLPWVVWGTVAPGVEWLRARFRLQWPPRPAVVLVHLLGVLGAMALFAFVSALLDHWFGLMQPRDPFATRFRDGMLVMSPTVAITYAATLGVGYAADHGRRLRQVAELQAELSRAQLAALRMQLNPHFLFNALHTFAVLAREGQAKKAVELVERLGDVLRHLLAGSTDLEAPLREEVAFLMKMLAIEQERFGERLAVRWAVDEPALEALVPQLLLQPLVENALRHGLGPRAAPGTLSISARAAKDRLLLAVADDGVGLRAGGQGGAGLGLQNVRARLQQMYGPTAALSLQPAPGGGVVASIELPLKRRGSGAEGHGGA